jgi:kinesin family protein 26
LTGIAAITGMDLSLRHPDGASDPNIKKSLEMEECVEVNVKENPLCELTKLSPILKEKKLPALPLLPISSSEDYYDSGHDESTPRASKHSGTDISRRIESVSGYHSVVGTIRDSDETSSLSSSVSRSNNRNKPQKPKKRHDKSLCNWLKNPFTCTYPDTEGEVSDF